MSKYRGDNYRSQDLKKKIVASKNSFCAIVTSYRKKFQMVLKVLINTFHLRYYTIWFLRYVYLTLGSKFFTSGELQDVKFDRHQKLISWALVYKLHVDQVLTWSDKNYSKIKGFAMR